MGPTKELPVCENCRHQHSPKVRCDALGFTRPSPDAPLSDREAQDFALEIDSQAASDDIVWLVLPIVQRIATLAYDRGYSRGAEAERDALIAIADNGLHNHYCGAGSYLANLFRARKEAK